MVDTAKKKRYLRTYQAAFKNVATPGTKRAFNNTNNINTKYKLVHGTKVKDPVTGKKYVLHGEKGRKLTTGRTVSRPKTTRQLTRKLKEDYVKKHGLSFLEMANQSVRDKFSALENLKNKNSSTDQLYNLISSTKVVDPKTKRKYVRHGPKGQEIVKTYVMGMYKTRLNNPRVPGNRKSRVLNSLFERFGVKATMNIMRGAKVGVYRSRNGNYVPSGRLHRADIIRAELAKLTNGQVSLGGRTKTLGEGVSGLAVTCVSNTKCKKDYKDLVLKVSAADDEWKNEVKFLTKITKWMDNNRDKDPLAPRILGSFKIGNTGFILMQNAAKVFEKAVSAKEWERYGTRRAKFAFLPAIKKAMKQLHEVGIMHGNMHSGNVWVAKVKNKDGVIVHKAYFADFGRSYNYNKAKKLKLRGNTWRYGNMMAKSINLRNNPNARASLMNDNLVMEQYEAAANK